MIKLLDYAHVLISILDYSYDGINWTTKDNSVTSANLYSVCYGNGKFVAVASSSDKIAYSYFFDARQAYILLLFIFV